MSRNAWVIAGALTLSGLLTVISALPDDVVAGMFPHRAGTAELVPRSFGNACPAGYVAHPADPDVCALPLLAQRYTAARLALLQRSPRAAEPDLAATRQVIEQELEDQAQRERDSEPLDPERRY